MNTKENNIKTTEELLNLCGSSGSYGGSGSSNIFVSTARVRNVKTKVELFGIDILKLIQTDTFSSLLITGDPGLGKTFLAKRLVRKLLEEFTTDGSGFLPILIRLTDVINSFEDGDRRHMNLRRILKKQLQLVNIAEKDIEGWRILLVVDGYDECNIPIQNFGESSILKHNVPLSIITFSRPDCLPPKFQMRECLFGLGKTFENSSYSEFELIAFSFSDVEDYVRQFCEVGHSMIPQAISWDASEYISWLNTIPDLQEICKTPLILSLILPVMPKIVEKYADKDGCQIRKICSTQTGIFDEFTQQWFEFQSNRNKHTNNLSANDFQTFCRIYSQNLAISLVDRQGFLNEGTLTLEDSLDLSLLEPGRDLILMADWVSKKNIFSKNKFIIEAIRDSCLLSYSKNGYHFFHRSIAQYFAAKEISEDLLWTYNGHINAEQNVQDKNEAQPFCSTAKLNFSATLLDQLGDRVRANQEFEILLLSIVRKSSKIAGLADLASKSLSILNAARYNFSGHDFRDIIVPYADMKQSFCAETDFRGANLQGIDFTRSYIVNARFEGANLRGANFGEELQITVPEKNRYISIREKLASYMTPSGNVNLIFISSKFNKSPPGKPFNRNAEMIAHVINFDTGVAKKTLSLGTVGLFEYNWSIIPNQLLLLTWKYNKTNFRDILCLTEWSLSTGKIIKKSPITRWFTFPEDSDMNAFQYRQLLFDQRGNWVVFKIRHDVFITRFALEAKNQYKYSFSRNETVNNISLAENSDFLAICTSEKIYILTLGTDNCTVVITNEEILDHPSKYHIHFAQYIFDWLSKFFAYVVKAQSGRPELKVYNMETKKISGFCTESELICSLSFNYNSTLLAAGDLACNIFIWNIDLGLLVQTFSRNSNEANISVCFHPEKNLLACSTNRDLVIKFWKVGSSLSGSVEETGDMTSSSGNIGYIDTTFDGQYIGCLNFLSVKNSEHFGESEKRKLDLSIWEINENKSFLSKPRSSKVGTFLGPGISFKFSNTQKCIVLGTLLTKAEGVDPTLCKNEPLIYQGCKAEPVALIYNLEGNLVWKIKVEHDSWKGLRNINYRSALFFDSSVCSSGSNLATAMWDGSIQLWKISDNSFVKTFVLIIPEQTFCYNQYKYVDPLNTQMFRELIHKPEQMWKHVTYLTFSACGNWVLSLTVDAKETVIFIWNVIDLKENTIPAYLIKMEMENQCRPLALEFNSQLHTLFWVTPNFFKTIHVEKHPNKCKVLSRNYKVELISGKMYEPFNWLVCGDRFVVLRIWNSYNIKNALLKITFWFPIYAITVHRKDADSVNIFFGGFYKNLFGVRVRKNLSWKLFRVFHSEKANLIAQNCNISQSLQVTEWNRRILNGLGAIGQPAHLRQQYYSLHQLFRELPGTASSFPIPSEVNTQLMHRKDISVDKNIWIVSIVAKSPKTKIQKVLRKFGVQHIFIVLEGSINLRKFAIRADLRQEPSTGNVVYILTAYESVSKFGEDMENCEGLQWEISPYCGRRLIQNIRRDQQVVWNYDFLLHNCIS